MTSNVNRRKPTRSRRGHGEGMIRKRDDGRWEARVDLGWIEGKRVRRSFYGTTRAEVAEKLRKALELTHGQAPLPDAKIRVGQFLDRWLDEVIKPTRQRATWIGYEVNVRRHIKPTLGHVRLAQLTAAHVQELVNAKADQGLSPRTVQYIHATLRAALSVAVKWGLVVRNVAVPVNIATVDREPVRPFSATEAHQVLAAAADHRLSAFFTVAMALGLRPSEALGLTWDDVDLDGGVVYIRKALERRRATDFKFKAPKSRKSRRIIPLPEVCVQALVQHRRRQSAERLAAGQGWHDHDLVFTTRFGGPLDRTQVSRQFTRLLRRAGVPHRRLYDCRHTAASLLLAQGVAPRVVMETLGHSSYALTMETYTHVLPDVMRDAAHAMDRALIPKPSPGRQTAG
ncbi:MAG TPA: site-specific integrase [Acidimicrobiales bacterium]|nr:site-specific integrase [Acidimicrobiales bacterium]